MIIYLNVSCILVFQATFMSLSDEVVNVTIFNCLDFNKNGFVSFDDWLNHMRLLNFGSTEKQGNYLMYWLSMMMVS